MIYRTLTVEEVRFIEKCVSSIRREHQEALELLEVSKKKNLWHFPFMFRKNPEEMEYRWHNGIINFCKNLEIKIYHLESDDPAFINARKSAFALLRQSQKGEEDKEETLS